MNESLPFTIVEDTYSIDGGSLLVGASVDANAGIAADVEPAVAAATGLRLVGYSIRESAGTPAVATVQLVHGATVAGGTVVATIELAASTSTQMWYGPEGIACASGISIEVVAGTVDVYVYHKTVT